MRVVAYNIKEFEKELLAKANAKVHDLTLISNKLSLETLHYSVGKEVIIISDQDILDGKMLDRLAKIGVKKVITRSNSVNHIDLEHAGQLKLHVANTPLENATPEVIAQETILNLNTWTAGGCLGRACHCSFDCSKKIEKK